MKLKIIEKISINRIKIYILFFYRFDQHKWSPRNSRTSHKQCPQSVAARISSTQLIISKLSIQSPQAAEIKQAFYYLKWGLLGVFFIGACSENNEKSSSFSSVGHILRNRKTIHDKTLFSILTIFQIQALKIGLRQKRRIVFKNVKSKFL